MPARLEVARLCDCCAHSTVIQPPLPQPTVGDVINKIIVFFVPDTNNTPTIHLHLLVNYQFMLKPIQTANSFGGKPESDFFFF